MLTSAEGRGVAGGEDKRKVLTQKQENGVRAFITIQDESGKQVFRRPVDEWIKANYGHIVSNRIA